MGNYCCYERKRYDIEVLEAEDINMVLLLFQQNQKIIVNEYRKLKSYMRDSNKHREKYYVKLNLYLG